MAVGGASADEDSTRAPRHPRLYFSAAELDSLRARTAGLQRGLWGELKGYCDAHVSDSPPSALPGDDYDARGIYLEREFLTRITNFSLAYLISRDARYRDAARAWLLGLARMPEWAGKCGNRPDAGLYAGFGEIALAVGYDWLYDDLSPEERAEVVKKLASVADTLYQATYEGEWWTGAYWHHDLMIPVAGLGVGALALRGERPEAEQWLARAIEETEAVLARIGEDGAWHEGAAPWAFGTMSLLLFLDPLERDAGRAFWSHPWIEHTAYYRLYAWLPPDKVVNFDDCHADGGYSTLTEDCAPILYRLARQYHDSHAQWLGDLDAAAKHSPHSLAWRLLWRDDTVKPRGPEDLPPSRFFPDHDLVIMRAGWKTGDPVVAFTCGPPLGKAALRFAVNPDGATNLGANVGSDHTHADQLSFMIYAAGDYLISPPGYGRKEASEENCILIGGKGPRRYADSREPIGEAGEITQVSLGPEADVAAGEAAAAYPPELGVKRAARRLAFAKPNVVSLSDSVRTERPQTVEWRFHGGPGVKIEDVHGLFRFVGKRATLTMSITSEDDLEARVMRDERHEWLSLRAREPERRVDFSAVLLIEFRRESARP